MASLKKLISNYYVNSSREYLNTEIKKFSHILKEGDHLLDAGAGDCKYKIHFTNQNYESADFCQVDKEYAKVDYICDLSKIPVENEKYDAILCSQVIEHLPEPKNVLQEFNRILKVEGLIWISAPLFYEEHEKPFDFYRYTQFAYQHMLKSTGFEIINIEWLEGYYGTISYQFKTMAKYLPLKPKDYGGGILGIVATLIALNVKIVAPLLSIFFGRIDLKHKYTLTGYCKNYFVLARKVSSVNTK